MLKILKLVRTFSRRFQQDYDPQLMVQIQEARFKKALKKRYIFPDRFKHEDILYQEELFGNKCQISGITMNSFKSTQFTRQVIQTNRPKLIILGGLNDTEAMHDLNQPTPKFYNIENYQPSKLYCKSTLLPLIQNKLQIDQDYFYQNDTKTIWRLDHLQRSIEVNDYYNVAYDSMFNDCKIIYGKPSGIIIFQDLMLRFSLQQLQVMFQRTLSLVQQNHSISCTHQSARLLQQIIQYAMASQPQLYSKQIIYTTALLSKLTKISSKNLLLIPKCFVKKIAEQVHHIDFVPDKVYRNWLNDSHSENHHKLSQITTNKKITQLLQKFAILSILKGSHVQGLLIIDNRNIFKNSIFHQLLGNITTEKLIDHYMKIRQKYMMRLFGIQQKRIKNKIQYHPPQTQYMHLVDQFETVQKRKQMFQYEFQPQNYLTKIKKSHNMKLLKQKMTAISQLEFDQYEKVLYKEFNQGNITKQGIILYSKLVGKANVQLKQKVKLPYYHYNAFRGIYKDYYRDHLLFDQDTKKRLMEMKQFQKLEDNFKKVTKQINDPTLLKRYLAGQMGPVKQIDLFQDERGIIDFQGDMEHLQELVVQMNGSQQMLKQLQQYRKNNPRNKEDQQDLDLQDQSQYDREEFQSKK